MAKLASTGVVFHEKLGTQGERVERLVQLAAENAPDVGGDPELAQPAASPAQAGLPQGMGGEFPELQGTMGSYYAAADSEAGEVSVAIGEFYQPRFSGDAIPATEVGRAVALADKLDSLVGIFGIGSAPTGDRDPFALRRAAIGLLRIIIESDIALDLRDATGWSGANHLARALRNPKVSCPVNIPSDAARHPFTVAGVAFAAAAEHRDQPAVFRHDRRQCRQRFFQCVGRMRVIDPVSYTHLRAHAPVLDLV